MASRQDETRPPQRADYARSYGSAGIVGWIFSGRRLVYVIAAILALWIFVTFAVHANSWKAVFLDNNQVYFGKFVNIPFSSNIKLKSVHYLKSTATSTDFIVASIKEDVHQPKDWMAISRKHVLLYEELDGNSSLVKAIEARMKQ
jgi:hypothetical protein